MFLPIWLFPKVWKIALKSMLSILYRHQLKPQWINSLFHKYGSPTIGRKQFVSPWYWKMQPLVLPTFIGSWTFNFGKHLLFLQPYNIGKTTHHLIRGPWLSPYLPCIVIITHLEWPFILYCLLYFFINLKL